MVAQEKLTWVVVEYSQGESYGRKEVWDQHSGGGRKKRNADLGVTGVVFALLGVLGLRKLCPRKFNRAAGVCRW